MNPSREIRKMYRSVIIDLLYREPDKWRIYGFDSYDSYLFYDDQTFQIKYYVFRLGKNIEIELSSGERLEIRDRGVSKLGYKMMDETKKRSQDKLDNKFWGAIPLTTKRRLKIEKVYK